MESSLDIKFDRIEKIAVENAKKDLVKLKDENDKISSEKVNELTEKYKEYLADKYEEELKKIDRDYNKELYDFEISERIRLNVYKDKLQESIKSSIKEKIEKFVDSNEYEDYLFNNIGIALKKIESSNNVIFITQKDIEKFSKKLEEKFSVKIERLDEKYIGGSIVVNKDIKVSVDNTLLTNIDEEIKKLNL